MSTPWNKIVTKDINQKPNQQHLIQQAVDLLKKGQLIAIPTETVYGLAADAHNETAVAKIFATKQRPSTNPLIIHLYNSAAMEAFATHIPAKAYSLAEHFWPGPLTLILERHPNVPKIVTGNQDTIALRVPNHPLTLELLKAFGGGLAAPSANRYGRISPTTARHVQEELGNQVDLILDGGPCNIGIESTIVSLVDSEVTILRQGSISALQIEAVLNESVRVKTSAQINHFSHHSRLPLVPGMELSHYAPSIPLYLHSLEDLLTKIEALSSSLLKHNKTVNILSFASKPDYFSPDFGIWIRAEQDPILYAKQLYGRLRNLDSKNAECILVETPPQSIEWAAILDRLQRASTRI